MLHIVEGPDGSGKTWLAEMLAKNLLHTYILKQGFRPRRGTEAEQVMLKASYATMLDIYLLHVLPHGKNMIFDRYFPSEIAYAPVMRGYDAYEELFYHRLEQKILALDHILWYVECPLDEIAHRFKLRGEDFVNIEQVRAIMENYEKFLAKTQLNVKRIKSGSDEAHDWIKTENQRVS